MPRLHHPLADLDTILAGTLETTAKRCVLGIAGRPGLGADASHHPQAFLQYLLTLAQER